MPVGLVEDCDGSIVCVIEWTRFVVFCRLVSFIFFSFFSIFCVCVLFCLGWRGAVAAR